MSIARADLREAVEGLAEVAFEHLPGTGTAEPTHSYALPALSGARAIGATSDPLEPAGELGDAAQAVITLNPSTYTGLDPSPEPTRGYR